MDARKLSKTLLIALMIFSAVGVYALAQMPHQFWGAVTIDGVAAPDGTVVKAKIRGVTYKETTTSGGNYGWYTVFQVPADDPDTGEVEGGANGDSVAFYVGSVHAVSYTFAFGAVTEVDLAITGTAEPTTSFEISLNEGWNLISLPLIPDDSATAVVLADIWYDVIVVWSFVESTNRWQSYVPPYGPGDLTNMVEDDGYWIEMSSAATLTIHGAEMPEPPAMPPTISLVAGWNLIGFKSLEAMIASSYLGPSVAADTIRMYGYADGDWLGVELSDSLEPGMGYWIAMDDSGTIYP